MVGGLLVFINEFGDSDKYLDMVIILASHACQSVASLPLPSNPGSQSIRRSLGGECVRIREGSGRDGRDPARSSHDPIIRRARPNTSSSIASVRRPVEVFCWLG